MAKTKPVAARTTLPPGKYFDRKLFFLSGVLFAGIVLTLVMLGSHKSPARREQYLQAAPRNTAAQETLAYRGQAGVDALTLLERKSRVNLDNSGMVIGINGRMADGAKHEYWEFMVNGKPATVGPKEYVTQKGDYILWKIAKY